MNLTLRLSLGLLSLQHMIALFCSEDLITLTQKNTLQTITWGKDSPDDKAVRYWIKNWKGKAEGQVVDVHDFMTQKKAANPIDQV